MTVELNAAKRLLATEVVTASNLAEKCADAAAKAKKTNAGPNFKVKLDSFKLKAIPDEKMLKKCRAELVGNAANVTNQIEVWWYSADGIPGAHFVGKNSAGKTIDPDRGGVHLEPIGVDWESIKESTYIKKLDSMLEKLKQL